MKARCRILVSYAFKTQGYRIWFLDTDEIVKSINVSFHENSQSGLGHSEVMMDLHEYIVFSPGTGENQDDYFVEVDTRVISSHLSNVPYNTQSSGKEDIDSGTNDVSSKSTIPSLREVSWLRKSVTRKIGNRYLLL